MAMPLVSHASAALTTPPRRVRVPLQLPHVSLRSEDFRRLRTGPVSWERLRAITACISSTKNANSFYVAAVVKPLCTFFSPLCSFLYIPYSLENTYSAQMFISAHLSSETVAGIVSAAKVRGDPGHHPGLNTRCAQSQGLDRAGGFRW